MSLSGALDNSIGWLQSMAFLLLIFSVVSHNSREGVGADACDDGDGKFCSETWLDTVFESRGRVARSEFIKSFQFFRCFLGEKINV